MAVKKQQRGKKTTMKKKPPPVVVVAVEDNALRRKVLEQLNRMTYVSDEYVQYMLKYCNIPYNNYNIETMKYVLNNIYIHNGTSDGVNFNKINNIKIQSSNNNFVFKDVSALTFIIISIFFDQLHDLKDAGNPRDNMFAACGINKYDKSKTKKEEFGRLFYAYLTKIKKYWSPVAINEVIAYLNTSVSGTETMFDDFYEKIFKNILGAKGESIKQSFSESDIDKNLMEYLSGLLDIQQFSSGPFPNTDSNEGGGTSDNFIPWMCFDMTSKSSGKSALGRSPMSSIFNKSSSVKNKKLLQLVSSRLGYNNVIDLPMVADKGSGFGHSPVGIFKSGVIKLFNRFMKNSNITYNDVAELMGGVIFFPHQNVQFNFIDTNNQEILKTSLNINPGSGNVELNLGTGTASSQVISAAEMAQQTDSADYLYKTWGDISIFLMSVVTRSTAVTGDTSAGTFYKVFSMLVEKGFISTPQGNPPSFIFEQTTSSVTTSRNFSYRPYANANNTFRNLTWRISGVNSRNMPINALNKLRNIGINNTKVNQENKKQITRFRELLLNDTQLLEAFYKFIFVAKIDDPNTQARLFTYINRKNGINKSPCENNNCIQLFRDFIYNLPPYSIYSSIAPLYQRGDNNIIKFLMKSTKNLTDINQNINSFRNLNNNKAIETIQQKINPSIVNITAYSDSTLDFINKTFKKDFGGLQMLDEENKRNFISELNNILQTAQVLNADREDSPLLNKINELIKSYKNGVIIPSYEQDVRLKKNKLKLAIYTSKSSLFQQGLRNGSIQILKPGQYNGATMATISRNGYVNTGNSIILNSGGTLYKVNKNNNKTGKYYLNQLNKLQKLNNNNYKNINNTTAELEEVYENLENIGIIIPNVSGGSVSPSAIQIQPLPPFE